MRLHEVYEDAEHVYILMENCKGGDLETLLEVRRLSTPYMNVSTLHNWRAWLFNTKSGYRVLVAICMPLFDVLAFLSP